MADKLRTHNNPGRNEAPLHSKRVRKQTETMNMNTLGGNNLAASSEEMEPTTIMPIVFDMTVSHIANHLGSYLASYGMDCS